jgi:hypothetical protein
MDGKTWQLALANGTYTVKLVMGDAAYTDQVNNVSIEGNVRNDPDGMDNFDEYTVTVTIADGKLDIAPAAGGTRQKVNFVEVTPASTTSTPLSRTGWTASASRGSGAANTLDGNASTRWDAQAPQAAGQWFQLNLGSAKTFNKIVLDASAFANDYPRGYDVFVSSDGVNWGSAIASGAGSGAVTTISFAAQTKQYVRIVLTASASNYWSIGEVNLYA